MQNPCRILIADDDEMLRSIFATALLNEGYDVLTAAAGEEALRRISKSPVDIALLDINLPDLSGIEVMKRIVSSSPTIVILITADVLHYSHASAIQQGAADFIVKPVRLPELSMRIKHARELRLLAEAKERLVSNLERLAVKDELTGLFNYRHFHEQVTLEIQHALRYHRHLSLIIFDVDNFKAVNDTLGHAEGDKVLSSIARAMSGVIRATDTIFRYGGDEFAVLLPETDGRHALAVSERTRQTVAQMALRPERPITISAGVAQFRPAEQGDDLLRRADAALYTAKDKGRNRVSLAPTGSVARNAQIRKEPITLAAMRNPSVVPT